MKLGYDKSTEINGSFNVYKQSGNGDEIEKLTRR